MNTRIIDVFVFVAFVCFVYPDELLISNLGKAFLAGMLLFWSGRTIEQFIIFKINSRYVHVLTLFFIAGAILFALPLLMYK